MNYSDIPQNEYYSELPNIITDNYQVINNTAEEDSTVCNVLNVSCFRFLSPIH